MQKTYLDESIIMKNSGIFLIFVIGIILFKPSDARLGIFDAVRDATQKVKQDVRSLISGKEAENGAKNPMASTVASIKLSDKVLQTNNDGLVFVDSDEDKVTYDKAPILKSNTDKSITDNKEAIVITTTPAITTTTVKEGRETLSGGCSTGFKRTPDGRCMPTF